MLPALRGFWPLSSLDETGAAYDLSGQARTLSYNGNPVYYWNGLAPIIQLDGGGDYLSRSDEAGLDITGTESYIGGGPYGEGNGITFGCWAKLDGIAPANDRFLLSKQLGTVAADISYSIKLPQGLSILRATVSNGATAETVDTPTIADLTWYHVIAKWAPYEERSIFLDGDKSTAATALGSLNNTASQFIVGGRDNGAGGATRFIWGDVSLVFICAAALPDVTCWALFQQTRALFNK